MMIFHYEHLVKFEEQEWNFGTAIPRRQGAIDSYLHDGVTYCACQNPSGRGSDGLHLPRTMKKVLYYFYERRLLRQICSGPMPTHIGIILDGNRRYGQRLGLTDPHAIYSLGAR